MQQALPLALPRLIAVLAFGNFACATSVLFIKESSMHPMFAAAYLVLARRHRHFPSVWLYLVPLYSVAAVFCLLVSFAFESPGSVAYGAFEWGMVLALGLVPTAFALWHGFRTLWLSRLRC